MVCGPGVTATGCGVAAVAPCPVRLGPVLEAGRLGQLSIEVGAQALLARVALGVPRVQQRAANPALVPHDSSTPTDSSVGTPSSVTNAGTPSKVQGSPWASGRPWLVWELRVQLWLQGWGRVGV